MMLKRLGGAGRPHTCPHDHKPCGAVAAVLRPGPVQDLTIHDLQDACSASCQANAHSRRAPSCMDTAPRGSRGQLTANVRVMALRMAAVSASATLPDAPGSPRHCAKAASCASTACSLRACMCCLASLAFAE